METEEVLISDLVWDKLRTAAEKLLEARSQRERQKAVKLIRTTLINELDVDLGAPW